MEEAEHAVAVAVQVNVLSSKTRNAGTSPMCCVSLRSPMAATQAKFEFGFRINGMITVSYQVV